MKNFMLKLSGVVASLLLLVSGARVAADTSAIGISPTVKTISVSAGQTVAAQVTVINDGDTGLNYRLYAQDFNITNEDYQKSFGAASQNKLDPANWFQLPQETLHLQPHQVTETTYQIAVPTNAPAGSHHAVVFAESVPDNQQLSGNGVRQIKRVGSLVYLTVAGDIHRSGQLVSFDTAFIQTGNPLKGNARVKNSGNDHFTVSGQFTAKSLLGGGKITQNFSGVVIPQTTRRFNVQLGVTHPVGLYQVNGTVTFLGQHHNLPKHWVLLASPFWLVIIVAVILIALYFITLPLHRRVFRRSTKRPQ